MVDNKDFIFTENAIKAVEETWKAKMSGIKLHTYVSQTIPTIHLAFIQIPKSKQKSGIGSHVMSDIIAVADLFNHSIKLNPFGGYGTPLHILEKFYKSFGFEWVLEDTMVRVPTKN
jgi:hypothetical protein